MAKLECGRLRLGAHCCFRGRETPKASLDGAKPATAPGEGAVEVPGVAGLRRLKVTTAVGVAHRTVLSLKPATLMAWKGKGHGCVSLLGHSLEAYAKADCQEDVTDAG